MRREAPLWATAWSGASGNGAIDISLVRSLPERDHREKLWKVRQQRPFAGTSW